VTDLLQKKGSKQLHYHICSGEGVNFVPAELEKEKKDLIASAAEKEKALKAKVKTIGNVVHESVPVSNNEVSREKTSCQGDSSRC